MPRKPRMYIPDIPCHVMQRGNNREASFFAEQDYQFYLDCLYDASLRYGVSIHAYVLMTNHVHLLLTPRAKDSISLVMQSIGRRYVQYINKEYRRTGTLWESCHKSSVVDADHYLLTCTQYIELNPVRANMVKHPIEYRWSSFACNALGHVNKWVTPHPIYQTLGLKDKDSQKTYLALFDDEIDNKDLNLIRNAATFSMPTGDSLFKRQIEATVNRKLGYMKRGRPAKVPTDECE